MSKEITEGTGNVFADMGLAQPRERQAKAMIAIYIEELIRNSGWTQAEAAEKMGLAQSDVSTIVNGRLKGFTMDRLLDCLVALGQEVQIGIRPHSATAETDQVLVPY